jgi:hypothetical protein
MDVFSLETEQGIQHTKLLLSHVRKQDQVGCMLLLSMEHLQLQAGVSWPMLSRNGATQWKYVNPCYLMHTWEFLDSINAQLRIEPDQWLCPQQQGDIFIME